MELNREEHNLISFCKHNVKVYTTRLEDMQILKNQNFEVVNVKHSLSEIINESKPPYTKNLDMKIISLNSSESSVNINERKQMAHAQNNLFFCKPLNISYNSSKLQNNPDFHMDLKRLPFEFMSLDHNKKLLKCCRPVTVDLSNEFENKLNNGTFKINLEGSDDLQIINLIEQDISLAQPRKQEVYQETLNNSCETVINDIPQPISLKCIKTEIPVCSNNIIAKECEDNKSWFREFATDSNGDTPIIKLEDTSDSEQNSDDNFNIQTDTASDICIVDTRSLAAVTECNERLQPVTETVSNADSSDFPIILEIGYITLYHTRNNKFSTYKIGPRGGCTKIAKDKKSLKFTQSGDIIEIPNGNSAVNKTKYPLNRGVNQYEVAPWMENNVVPAKFVDRNKKVNKTMSYCCYFKKKDILQELFSFRNFHTTTYKILAKTHRCRLIKCNCCCNPINTTTNVIEILSDEEVSNKVATNESRTNNNCSNKDGKMLDTNLVILSGEEQNNKVITNENRTNAVSSEQELLELESEIDNCILSFKDYKDTINKNVTTSNSNHKVLDENDLSIMLRASKVSVIKPRKNNICFNVNVRRYEPLINELTLVLDYVENNKLEIFEFDIKRNLKAHFIRVNVDLLYDKKTLKKKSIKIFKLCCLAHLANYAKQLEETYNISLLFLKNRHKCRQNYCNCNCKSKWNNTIPKFVNIKPKLNSENSLPLSTKNKRNKRDNDTIIDQPVVGVEDNFTSVHNVSSRPNSMATEENAPDVSSDEVSIIISEILTRFEGVRLTLNRDRQVMAMLDKPKEALSTLELKILSQILNHAQEQVDKLDFTKKVDLQNVLPSFIPSIEPTLNMPPLSFYPPSTTENFNQEEAQEIDPLDAILVPENRVSVSPKETVILPDITEISDEDDEMENNDTTWQTPIKPKNTYKRKTTADSWQTVFENEAKRRASDADLMEEQSPTNSQLDITDNIDLMDDTEAPNDEESILGM